MLKNYWRAAWRRLRLEKGFAAINIFGLALGLATCILITLFVADELGYDRFHTNSSRIFRIASDIHINGGTINSIFTPASMAAALSKDYPAVQAAVRLRAPNGVPRVDLLVHISNKTFAESGSVLADSTFFTVFTFPMITGDPHTALASPNSLVLSATAAKRYFNSTDVLGRTLLLDDDTTLYTVSGVIRDMPGQSHFHFQLIRPMRSRRQDWINLYSATYILVRPGITRADIDRMLAQTVDKYVHPQIKAQLHTSAADMARNGDFFRYYSMPLTQIHLYSNLGGEFEPNGNMGNIRLFMVVALLVLLVACVNFTNLSTARSARRSREIGVRKVLGSGRRQLISQFLTESLLMSFIAMVLALLLILLLLPWFNRLTGKELHASFLLSGWTLAILFSGTVAVGLLSGAYPAFYLSGFQPVKVLYGRLAIGFRAGWLRTVLLVFQFSVAMVLIIGTAVIYSQLYFIRHKQLGYTREQVLTVKDTRFLDRQTQTFADEARRLPGVLNATVSGSRPDQKPAFRGFFKDQTATMKSTVLLEDWSIDPDYLPTLKMQVIAGRNFSSRMPTDSGCVLINETAARTLGYANPIGETVYTGPDPLTGYRIIGLVKDFNTGSLSDPIDPIVFRLAPDINAVSFRIAPDNITATLAGIRRVYESMAKGHPFVYSFLDDDFNRLYQADQRTGNLFTTFSILAIFIAGIGMFGLVTAATEQRTKELGIRRVLGARVIHLILLLSKDYGWAILLAVLIAVPAGAWAMHAWLQGFAYRTNLHPWIFIAAPLAAISIAMLIVSIKASQAAWANLTAALRVDG
ncbi:MAG TPA: ABC transporter permease [Puia sp.]|nr:ABC transporter permease [Puia sp.]